MKNKQPFEIYLNTAAKSCNRELLKIKNPVLRRKIVYNFVCSISYILEYWLHLMEKFQGVVNHKWKIIFKLPDHFENYFIDHTDEFRVICKGRKTVNFPIPSIVRKAKKIIYQSTDIKKNSAGAIALCLLVETHYYVFLKWVELWAPEDIMPYVNSTKQSQVINGNNKMRSYLLRIIDKEVKKNKISSNKEIEDAKKIFAKLIFNLFPKQ